MSYEWPTYEEVQQKQEQANMQALVVRGQIDILLAIAKPEAAALLKEFDAYLRDTPNTEYDEYDEWEIASFASRIVTAQGRTPKWAEAWALTVKHLCNYVENWKEASYDHYRCNICGERH